MHQSLGELGNAFAASSANAIVSKSASTTSGETGHRALSAAMYSASLIQAHFCTGLPASFQAPSPPSRLTRFLKPRPSILVQARALRPPPAQWTR